MWTKITKVKMYHFIWKENILMLRQYTWNEGVLDCRILLGVFFKCSSVFSICNLYFLLILYWLVLIKKKKTKPFYFVDRTIKRLKGWYSLILNVLYILRSFTVINLFYIKLIFLSFKLIIGPSSLPHKLLLSNRKVRNSTAIYTQPDH